MTITKSKQIRKGLEKPSPARPPAIAAHVPVVEDAELADPEQDGQGPDALVAHQDRVVEVQARLETIQADLEAAEKAQQDAEENWSHVAGRSVLEEADDSELAEASKRYQDAQARTVATRAALNILTQRQREHEAQAEAARAAALREQSDSAHRAQMAALDAIARASAELTKALEDAQAEGLVLADLHKQLAEAEPERAAEVAEDHRDALARITNQHAAKRAAIYEAAEGAQYRLQAPSDGSSEPRLPNDLIVLGDRVAEVGTPAAEARVAVLDWQVRALEAVETDERAAIEEEAADHAARTLVAGLGHLPASPSEVRDAAAFPVSVLAMVLPADAKRSLAALRGFLPGSAWEGISSREIRPKDATSAKVREREFERGRGALDALAN